MNIVYEAMNEIIVGTSEGSRRLAKSYKVSAPLKSRTTTSQKLHLRNISLKCKGGDFPHYEHIPRIRRIN